MKNLLKILSTVALVAVLFSCEDLLDNAQPSTAISQSQALNSPGGVEAIRTSMYSRLHGFAYATSYYLAPESLADNLIIRAGATRFVGQNQNSEGVHVENWGAAYNLINDANLLITGIPEGVLSASRQSQFVGEALTLRAFAYHHLARSYAYEPGVTPETGDGAGFNLGVILRTQPVLDANAASYRPRSTVQETYDRIISDLERAINILSDGDEGTRTYITVSAAQALLARVHLYARNYDLADQYATDAINSTSASLAQPEDVATMFDETTGLNPEAIFIVPVNPNTESLGANNALSAYTSQQWGAQVPTQDLLDLYEDDDARLALYRPCFNELDGTDFANCVATHPTIEDGNEGLEIAKWAAEQNQFADNYPHFRISEMLLIQSEARLNSGGDAATPLNTLRSARGVGPVATVTIEDILDERRREFAAEGHRFFDLKRLGMDIQKAPETINNIIQPLPFNDFRILNNIPDGEVSLSEANAPTDSVLVQNPGH